MEVMETYTMNEQTYTKILNIFNKEGRLDVDYAARCSTACAAIAKWVMGKMREWENDHPNSCLMYTYVEPKIETVVSTETRKIPRSTVPSHRISSPEPRNKNAGILNRKDLYTILSFHNPTPYIIKTFHFLFVT